MNSEIDLVTGARLAVEMNRPADGIVSTVTCVMIETERPGGFAWNMLDDAGDAGSTLGATR